MGNDAVDRVLGRVPPVAPPAPAPTPPVEELGDKFYSALGGEGLYENFLELRFRIGMRTCFSYTDLMWFNYDPEGGCIDLEFGGYLVTLKGRGLGDALFNHIKQKRVAWIKEADLAMEDHPGNTTFIQEITITPPSSESGEEKKAE